MLSVDTHSVTKLLAHKRNDDFGVVFDGSRTAWWGYPNRPVSSAGVERCFDGNGVRIARRRYSTTMSAEMLWEAHPSDFNSKKSNPDLLADTGANRCGLHPAYEFSITSGRRSRPSRVSGSPPNDRPWHVQDRSTTTIVLVTSLARD